LIRKNTCCRYGVFKVRASSSPALQSPSHFCTSRFRRHALPARSLKAQQRTRPRRQAGSDITSGRRSFQASPNIGRARASSSASTSRTASGVIAPDSLERR